MKHLRRLFPYLHRHRGAYFLGLGIVVLAAACGAAAPLLLRYAVNELEHNPSRAFVIWAAVAIVLFAVVRGALTFASRYAVLASARRIEYEFRNDLFSHLETLSARWYDTHATGDITSRMINDLDSVRLMIGFGILSLVATGLLTIASIVTMFILNPGLAGLLMAPLALISVVMAWTGSKMHSRSLAIQEQLGVLSNRAQENFTGARVVRAFTQEENEIARYRSACVEYRDRNMSLARWRAAGWALILLLIEVAMVLTLYSGGKSIMAGTLTKGDLVAFMTFQFELLWPMIAIGWVINLTQRGLACMGRLAEILDARPDTDDAQAVPGKEPVQGRIEARGLTFAYAPDRPAALDGVTFSIEPGRKVALVGRTGSGKSTLVQLLLRHYRAPDGMLFVDGRDINTIPLAEIRGAIGTVPQDPFLFSDKIRENIAFGGRNGVADEQISRAAEISRLAADLDQFPDRLDQVIGERGVTLSGGQKQRTALARAIVREPAILVLDDALSSVDSHTEQEIQVRLCEFLKGRTSLVITHRLSAIADADLILVLNDGELVEQGRHDTLLAAGGTYARLWESQKLAEELTQT